MEEEKYSACTYTTMWIHSNQYFPLFIYLINLYIFEYYIFWGKNQIMFCYLPAFLPFISPLFPTPN